jgi:hypothetical protein
MEFEMNPLNAVWYLYLPKAYNKGGKADHDWDFDGIQPRRADRWHDQLRR